MSDEIIYSFIVRDVSVTMDENTIKNDLMQRYNGISKVTRMYDDDEDETPKTTVQVDFTLADDAEKIFQDKNMVIGGICRRVYAIKKPFYRRSNQKLHENEENTNKFLSEQDILNMFEEQKKHLNEILNSLDEKLNNAINHRQNKSTVTA